MRHTWVIVLSSKYRCSRLICPRPHHSYNELNNEISLNPILRIFLAVASFNKRTYQVSYSMIYWCLLNFVWFSVTISTWQKNKIVPSSWLVRFSVWGQLKGVSEFLCPINSKNQRIPLSRNQKIYTPSYNQKIKQIVIKNAKTEAIVQWWNTFLICTNS